MTADPVTLTLRFRLVVLVVCGAIVAFQLITKETVDLSVPPPAPMEAAQSAPR